MHCSLGYARISHGGLSDTELQLGRFQIPKNLRDYKDNEKMVTDSRHVDSSVQFNPVWVLSIHFAYFCHLYVGVHVGMHALVVHVPYGQTHGTL